MTYILFAVLNSALATADAAFSRAFQALWLQTLSEHRRVVRRQQGSARRFHFS